MKTISKTNDAVTYRFENKEWVYFLDLLRLFPLLKEDYYRFKTKPEDPKLADTHLLLTEMLSDYKLEQKRWLDSFLSKHANEVHGGGRDASVRLKLSFRERENLLEILNDIRVGSWMALGSPDSKDPDLELKLSHAEELRQIAWAMDLSGYFQTGFLRSIVDP